MTFVKNIIPACESAKNWLYLRAEWETWTEES